MLTRFAALAASLCLSACVSAQTVAGPDDGAVIAPATLPIAPEQYAETWLYGSAESQIAMRQGWDAIASHGEAIARTRPAASVWLTAYTPAADGSVTEPGFEPCGNKPLAAVFDADETIIWNMGVTRYQSERRAKYDPVIWGNWERTGAAQVVAAPGAVAAFARLRAAGLTIIVNTNREARNADRTAEALKRAGLGDFVHGQTLYLKGDSLKPGQKPSSAKDGRRSAINASYCIVILAGDQLGDISDAFNDPALTTTARRAMVNSAAFDGLWNRGWFILPNPLYGPWQDAKYTDIYPEDTRWAPTTKGE